MRARPGRGGWRRWHDVSSESAAIERWLEQGAATRKGRRALRRRPLLAAAGPASPVPPHSICTV